MRSNHYSFLYRWWISIILLSAVAMGSCTTVNEVVVLSPPTGSLFGKLHLMNFSGPVQHNGSVVQIAGTSLQGVTDTQGSFLVDSIPSGTYTIQCSHPGYGTIEFIGRSIVAPGVTTLSTSFRDSVAYLYQLPYTAMQLQVDSLDSKQQWICHINTDTSLQSSTTFPLNIVAMLTDSDPHASTPNTKLTSTPIGVGSSGLYRIAFDTSKLETVRQVSWYLTTYAYFGPRPILNPILSNTVQVFYP